MRFEDFTLMPIEEMAEIVWARGVFLFKKKYSNKLVQLYSLDNFFVELWYIIPENMRDFNFLDYIRPFPRIKAIEEGNRL